MEKHTPLNIRLRAKVSVELESELKRRVIGQDPAIEKIVATLSRRMSGLNKPRKPLTSMLFLGPTGCGKTKLCETLAEIIFGSPDSVTKINCAELQESQGSLKLLGSAPGYIGFTTSEENMYLSQKKLDAYQTSEWPVNILILDEIEKAHDNVFRLLLGVLDKANLSLNNGQKIDFTKTIIFMTSNLGAREVSQFINNKLGFDMSTDADNEKAKGAITTKSIKKQFTPEFINRIDEIVNFTSLSKQAVEKILDIECSLIQKRIILSAETQPFTFTLTPEAREFIITKGTSKDYGARELTRTLDREVVNALSALILTKQVGVGDTVIIDVSGEELIFSKSSDEINCSSTELTDITCSSCN